MSLSLIRSISETKSLTASVTDYPVVWGRRYHKYKEGCKCFIT